MQSPKYVPDSCASHESRVTLSKVEIKQSTAVIVLAFTVNYMRKLIFFVGEKTT